MLPIDVLCTCDCMVVGIAVVISLAGSGNQGFANGAGTQASFNYPQGVAVDASGTVFVADSNNHRICVISPTRGTSDDACVFVLFVLFVLMLYICVRVLCLCSFLRLCMSVCEEEKEFVCVCVSQCMTLFGVSVCIFLMVCFCLFLCACH
jgi:hypothetical protein